jgi:hypothetical protein
LSNSSICKEVKRKKKMEEEKKKEGGGKKWPRVYFFAD